MNYRRGLQRLYVLIVLAWGAFNVVTLPHYNRLNVWSDDPQPIIHGEFKLVPAKPLLVEFFDDLFGTPKSSIGKALWLV